MSKFLSEEWAQDVTTALNNHEGFKNAIGAADLGIQFEVEGGPECDRSYYLKSSGGTTNLAVGEIEG